MNIPAIHLVRAEDLEYNSLPLLDAVKKYLNTKGKNNLTLIRTGRSERCLRYKLLGCNTDAGLYVGMTLFCSRTSSDADYGQFLYNSLLSSTEAYQQQVPSTCALVELSIYHCE